MELARQNNTIAITGRLKEIKPEDFREFLLRRYNSLLLKNGQNAPTAENAVVIVNELYKYLQEEWPGIKTEWITEAFNNGINGKYGEFANISYRLMVYWIMEFKYSMRAEDFGLKEDPMHTSERANFLLKNKDKILSLKELKVKHKSNR